MQSQDKHPADLPPSLSVWDAASMIVGIVIGTGIYQTVPFILSNLGPISVGFAGWPFSATVSVILVWAVAGLLSLVGGLCYAELATHYPQPGGDVVYLSQAYGNWLGFLFGYAQLAIILTANIGMMTYVFADYTTRLLQTPESWSWLWAAGAVVGLTALNSCGARAGKTTQNILTVNKVLGLGAIIVVGMLWPAPPAEAAAPAHTSANIPFAMVLIMITYGGWNDAAYVAAEVRDQRRGILRALILGITAVTLIYLLVNYAYINALGYRKASESKAIAADVLRGPLRDKGEAAMCILVMISALGAANGLIFTGSRVSLRLGQQHRLFAWLGRWHGARNAPLPALLTQAVISLAMIVLVGSGWGQQVLTDFFIRLGMGPADWAGTNGFISLLKCTAPVFWLFFLLTGLSLFVLRQQRHFDPGPRQAFAVPFYPYLPLVFCATCVYMLDASLKYAGAFGAVGGSLLLLGLPLYEVSRFLDGRAA